MALDRTFRSSTTRADLRVYESAVPGHVTFYPAGANRSSRLSRESVRMLRDALTEYLGDAAPAAPAAPTFSRGDRVKIADRPTSRQFGTLIHRTFHGKRGTVAEGPTAQGDYRVRVEGRDLMQYIAPESLTKIEPEPFERGDRVKIAVEPKMADGGSVPGRYYDATGVIVSGPDEDGDYRVKLREEDADWTADYIGARFLTKEEDDEPETFEPGDRVRVADERQSDAGEFPRQYAGQVGKVEGGPDGDGDYKVRFQSSGRWEYVHGDHLTAAEEEPAPRFAVGDLVKVGPAPRNAVAPLPSRWAGVVAKIAYGPDPEGDYRLVADGVEGWAYAAPAHLTKIGQARFSAGDRVRVRTGMYAGTLGEVTTSVNRYGNVVMRRDNGRDLVVAERKLEASPAPAFSRGDRVRVSSAPKTTTGGYVAPEFAGALGVISADEPSYGGNYQVRVDSRTNWIGPDHLTKVEEEKPRFTVGDRVRLTEEGARYISAEAGAEAIVERLPLAGSPWLRVKWDRSDSRVSSQMDGGFNPEHFERVEAPAPATFEPGDRVKLADRPRDCFGAPYRRPFSGAVGEVERKLVCGDYRVKLDDGRHAAVRPADLTKVEEPAPLAVGDLVLIGDAPKTSNGSGVDPRYFGGVGEIIEGRYTLDGDHFVKLVHQSPTARPDGSTSWRSDGQCIAARHLTRVERLDRDARPENGTRVVVLDDQGARTVAEVGATGRIVDAFPEPGLCGRLLTVEQDNGRRYQMFANRFGRIAS